LSRIDRGLEIALGLVFLAAGVLKIADPAGFAVSLALMNTLPAFLLGPVAILLPWVEVVAGLALIATRRYRDAATWLILGLLIPFTAALTVSMVRGTGDSCGCFGGGSAFLNRPEVGLVRNVLLAAAAVVLIRRRITSRSEPTSPASDTGR
jgi:putative oxidoreductase